MTRPMRSGVEQTARILTVLLVSMALAGTALADSPVLVRTFAGSEDPPDTLHALGRVLLLVAGDPASGREPWRSDGTAAGTAIVKDVWPGLPGSQPFEFVTFGGYAYFNGHDGVTGRELWRTDGTAAGTTLVRDIRPGTGWSNPTGFVVSGGSLYFVADNGTAGLELWRSDGTAAGTTMVCDIRPGSGWSAPYGLTDVSGTLFFWADNGVTGYELWKSDGTPGGTVLVRDILPGAASSIGGSPVGLGGVLIFSANDGVHGDELWRSDGTAAGTVLLRDINPGATSSSPSARANVVQGKFHLFAADDGVSGRELWITDGTTPGTRLVSDINPGSAASGPSGITVLGSIVFLRANDGVTGRELWISDGTVAGTRLVRDIRAGGATSDIGSPTAMGGALYFTADDGVTGTELWRSDGTTAGTQAVADLWPGFDGAFPDDLVAVGGTLYFTAEDGSHGRALWKYAPTPSAPVLSAIPGPLVIGAANTVTGANFTAGSVVKLYVATSKEAAAYGPYAPAAWTPTALTFGIPGSVPAGTGFASVQVVNTDTDYLASNVVGALLFGSAAAGLPTITAIGGVPLAPASLSIPLAHVDTVLAKGATVAVGGTGFADPVVSVFTAAGQVDLVPTTWTATSVSVVVPAGAATGPGTFRVVNRPSYRESNAVATVIGAVPTIASAVAAGGVITVTGAGFSELTVINLYNQQGGGVVNLGGFGPGGVAKIPLTSVSETQFRFVRPTGAVAGPAFVEALNPPFIPFSSSGSDPGGAFTMPAAPPLWTERVGEGEGAAGASEAGDAGSAAAGADDGHGDAPGAEAGSDEVGDDARGAAQAGVTREVVRWTRPVYATVDGDALAAAEGRRAVGAQDDGSDGAPPTRRAVLSGRPGAGARSTRALLDGDGAVSWTVRADAGDVAFGFGDTDADGSLADLAFAWRVDPVTRELQVYERGVRQAGVGTYAAGDRLRVDVRAGAVEYRRNGALVFTSTTAPRYPLVVDASLGSADGTLRGVRLAGRLGTVIDWSSAPGVRTGSMAVTAEGPPTAALKGPRLHRIVGVGDVSGPIVGARGLSGPGTGTAGSAAGYAVAADLRGAAGIGFGSDDCDYCIVRVDDRTVQVQHAGVVRGTWAAPAGTRVRVEIGADGVVRYWVGEVQLDEAPLPGNALASLGATPGDIRGCLGAPNAAIVAATTRR